jgi:formylglycine-generating enzyme required for sulfatase activity/uncharacterized caspase-like protein
MRHTCFFTLAALLCAVLLFNAWPAQAQLPAGQRLALVIGNDSYTSITKLANARADARAMAGALQQAGFEVTLRLDLTRGGMLDAVRTFKARLGGGAEAVFFFAGHGVQLGAANYLLPVDISAANEEQVRDDALALQRVLEDMTEQKARFSLAIIDACRNNPFPRVAGRSIGGTRGLAPTTAATGQMVIYSAGAGQEALDKLNPGDPNPNGLFTRVFLQEMQRPGVEVGQMLRNVRNQVVALARKVGHEQVPALYDQAVGEFMFRPGAQVAAIQPAITSAPQADPRADDRALWEAVKDSSNPAELQAYLEQFPNGIYAGVARARIKALAPKPPPVQVAVAPPTVTTTRPDTATAQTDLTPGTTFRDCDVCPEMVVIPPGSFTMGAPSSEEGRFDAEGPQRRVNIARAFGVGKYEVTRGEFAQFVNETNRQVSGCWVRRDGKFQDDASKSWRDTGFAQNDNHPVACVNWDDAKAYVAWLSRKSGKSYRLLTEAEWEYAARAGTSTAYYWGESPDCRYANGADEAAKTVFTGWTGVVNCADNHVYTAPVGSFQPNAFGLHDMSGNVLEWTEDCWNANYNGALSDSSARTTGECGQRVLRGGSWDGNPRGLRSAGRLRGSSGLRNYGGGLRVARTF